jgi:glutamyl endopeptidase
MKIRSVPKPATESDLPKPAPVYQRSTLRGSDNALAKTVTTQRRLVVGKSDQPLRPSDGGLGLESVIGLDERTRILETEQAPWRMVCALEIDGPWGTFVGTGWFAGPRTLVTAGHCVYDRNQMGGWARSISVRPGRDGDREPFGSFETEKFSTVDMWLERQDPDFDIAAIHLSQPLGEEHGWFAVGSLTDDELRGYFVNVSGYPAQPGGGAQQWWARNRVREVTPRRIFYDVDTSGGQSGGPAYIYEQENAPPLAVGIHAYGVGGTPSTIPQQVNSAPRIIPEVVEQIRLWVEQDNGNA